MYIYKPTSKTTQNIYNECSNTANKNNIKKIWLYGTKKQTKK